MKIYLKRHKNKFFDFTGMTGKVVLDENADREPDYWVWSYKPGRVKLEPFLKVRMTLPAGPEVTQTLKVSFDPILIG